MRDGGLYDAEQRRVLPLRHHARLAAAARREAARDQRAAAADLRRGGVDVRPRRRSGGRRRARRPTSPAGSRGAAGGYCGSEGRHDGATPTRSADGERGAARRRRARLERLSDARPRGARVVRARPAGVVRPGRGVAHYTDGASRVRGLLADYVAVIHALLDAHEVTGRRALQDDGGGAGALRASDDVGRGGGRILRSRRTSRPSSGCCEPAQAVCHELRGRACPAPAGASIVRRRIFARLRTPPIQAMAPVAATQGPLAAHYVLALRELSAR